MCWGHEEGPPYLESDMEHGFLASRRREDAIAACMCVSWRLNKGGFYWLDSLKDMSNAFGSTDWAMLDDAARTLVNREHTHLCKLRFRSACCLIPGADKPLLVRTGCGALMGDPFAVRSFSRAFRPPCDQWLADYRAVDPEESRLVARCSLFTSMSSGSQPFASPLMQTV